MEALLTKGLVHVRTEILDGVRATIHNQSLHSSGILLILAWVCHRQSPTWKAIVPCAADEKR
jgi:hypothetical protein